MEQNTTPTNTFSERANNVFNALKKSGVYSEEHRNLFLEKVSSPENAEKAFNALKENGVFTEDHRDLFLGKLYPAPKGVPYADAPARSSMIDPVEVARNAAKNLQERRDAEQKRLEDFTSKALREHNTDTTLGLQERIRQNQLLSDAIDEELNKSLKEKASKEDFEDYVKNPEKYRAKQRQGILSTDNLNRNVQLSKLQERKKALDEDTRKLMGEDFQTRLDEIEIKRIAAGLKTGRYEIDDNGTIVDISRPIPTLDSGAGYYRYEKKKVSDFVLKRAKELASSMNDEDATMFSENDHILDMTVRNLNKALRMSKLDNDAGGWSKFLSGVRTTWDGGRVLPYLNLLKLRDLMSYRNALGRIESGEGTEADKELVASQLDKETAQRLYNEGFAGKLAMGTLESLSFMVDMVIGGKVGSSIKIGEGAAKGLMKAGIKKEVIRGAERLAAQAATLPISPAPYLDIERRQIQNYHAGYDPDGQVSVSKSENAESVASSALNAFAQNLISRSVETVVGPVADKVIGSGAKWLVTGGGKVKFTNETIKSINKFLEKSKGGLTGEVMQAFNMQNFAGEMVEEIAEEPLQRLLVAMTAVEKDYAEANGTGRWSGMYGPEFWGQTLGTIGLMQMLFRLPGISAKGADMAHNALGMHTGLQMLNDRQRVTLKEIMKMDDDNQRAIALSRMMNGTTQEERQGIVRYVVSRVAQNMMTSYQQAEAQQNDMAAYRNTLMQITADTEGDVLFAEEKSTGNRYVIKNISPNDPAMVAYPAELQPDGMYKFGKPRVMDGSAFNLVGAKFVSIDELIAEKEQHDAQINEQQDQVAEAEMDNALNPVISNRAPYTANISVPYLNMKGIPESAGAGASIQVLTPGDLSEANPEQTVEVSFREANGGKTKTGTMTIGQLQELIESGKIKEGDVVSGNGDIAIDAEGKPIVAEGKAEGVGTSIPQDDKGRTQYEAAPLEDTVRSIYEESGLSAEQADAFVNKKLTAARSEVEKLAKKEPQIDTFDEIPLYQRAHEQWKQQMDAAQAKAEYWESVKGARATEEVQGAEGENTVAEDVEPAAPETVEENGLIGRSATEEEAEGIISQMEANAEEAPEVELTPENWTEQFGEKGETNTPIGTVKMGENQLAKMFLRKRDKEFGMIFPTLTDPDLIIEEESSAKDGSEERPSSYLFVKTFLRDGKKVKHYASVTVQKEGMEVVVSNHYLEESALKGKLQNGKVLYTKEALLSNSSDGHLAEHQNGVPDLLPTQENNASSENKGTEVSEEKQVRLPENPVAVMYESLLSENEGNETEAVDTAQQMVANKTAELEQARKIQAKGKTTDAIQAAKRAKREKVAALETEVKFWKDVAAYPEAKRQAEEAARKLQKRINKQQAAEKASKTRGTPVGKVKDTIPEDPKSIEEDLLRRIASGAIVFNSKPKDNGTKTLEAFIGQKIPRRYLNDEIGVYPEPFSEEFYLDLQSQNFPYGVVSSEDIHSALRSIDYSKTPSEMMARAEELHNKLSDDEARYNEEVREAYEEAEREERAREEAAADIAQASVEYMSDEEYDALSRPEFVGEMFNTDGTPKRVARKKQAQEVEKQPSETERAIASAEAQTDTNPTEKQKEAGNYRKGHVKVNGFDLTIENPKGSERSGVDGTGRAWKQTMHNTYGYIRGTEGVDGDHIDVFLSDTPETGDVFVIDQVNPKTGAFDEHKVMMGFDSEEAAREAYLSNYEDGWQGLGGITRVSQEEFKKWIDSSHRKTKPFAEYKGVAKPQVRPVQLAEAYEDEDNNNLTDIQKENVNNAKYHLDREIKGPTGEITSRESTQWEGLTLYRVNFENCRLDCVISKNGEAIYRLYGKNGERILDGGNVSVVKQLGEIKTDARGIYMTPSNEEMVYAFKEKNPVLSIIVDPFSLFNNEVFEGDEEVRMRRGEPRLDNDLSEEERGIVERSKADGTYLKAPNGKPTKLSPKQWAQVRTKAFKDWFGEWELANLYNRAVEAWQNNESKGKVVFGLSERAKARFSELLGKDVKQLIITDDSIRHIRNNHSEREELRGQKNMTPEDVVVIPYLVNNFDSMELSPKHDDNQGNRAIEIHKRINGVSVIATIEKGENKEFLVTSYQFVKSDALDASNETPGPNVRNDSDLAKVQKDIKKIKEDAINVSKVVDENGEPLVVYHGTRRVNSDGSPFTVFKDGLITFFTDNISVADYYGGTENEIDKYRGRVYESFVNIKNPLIVNANGAGWDNIRFNGRRSDTIDIGRYGYTNGYDGVILHDIIEVGKRGNNFLAFSPNQIKSATDNVGAFDAKNPDIRFRLVGELFDAEGRPVRFRFIGEKGAANLDKAEEATTRLDNLSVAREMESTGKEAKAIKMATGWERGADGKWRYETEDNLESVQFKTRDELIEELWKARRNRDNAYNKWYRFASYNPTLHYRVSKKKSPEENERIKKVRTAAQKKERELFTEHKRLNDRVNELVKRASDGLLGVPLSEVIGENNSLLKAYPEMDEISVSFYPRGRYIGSNGASGFYQPEYKAIFIDTDSTKEKMRSTLGHELQHAVQHIEGFSRGGHPSEFKGTSEDVVRDIARATNGKLLEGGGIDITTQGIFSALNRETAYGGTILRDNSSALDAVADKYGYETIFDLVNNIDKFKSGMQQYRSLAGEVEARNVQSRMNMTPEERRNSLAAETEDVAREEQIFLNDALGASAALEEKPLPSPSSTSGKAKREAAEALSRRLGVPVVIEDRSTPKGRSRRYGDAKGWFVLPNAKNPNGVIHVNVDNHADVKDVERTIAHEVVAHMGMRKMLGAERYNALLDNVYDVMNAAARAHFEDYARSEFSRKEGMTDEEYRAELQRVAADEYIAALAEVGTDPTTWQKVVALVREALRAIGFNLSLSDADIRALLYESKHNLESAAYAAERDMFRQRQEEFRAAAELDRMLDENIAEYEREFGEENGIRMRRSALTDKRLGVISTNEKGGDFDLTTKQGAYRTANYIGTKVRDSALPVYSLTSYLKKYGLLTPDTDLFNKMTTVPSKMQYRIQKVQYELGRPTRDAIQDFMKGLDFKSIFPGEKDVFNTKGKAMYPLSAYLMARHMAERTNWFRKQNKDNKNYSGEDGFTKTIGMTPEKYVKAFEKIARDANKIRKLAKVTSLVRKCTDFSLRELVRGGCISQEAYKELKSRGWRHYVPLRGWDIQNNESDNFADILYPEGNNFGRKSNPVKKAYGRTSMPNDPLSYIFMDMDSSVARAEENLFYQSVAQLHEDNRKFDGIIFETPDNIGSHETVSQKDSRLIPYFKDGKRFAVVFNNPKLAAAIRGDSEKKIRSSWFNRNVSKVTRFQAAMNTSLNAAFAFMNLVRDVKFAAASRFIESKNPIDGFINYAKFYIEMAKTLPAAFASASKRKTFEGTGKSADLVRAWKENGGETGWHTLSTLQKTKDDLYRDLTQGQFKKLYHGFIKGTRNALRYASEVSENWVRLAAFSDAKRRGLSDQEAAYYSKEVTTNFNRHSAYSTRLNPLYMFLNAQVQGINRFLRLAKNNPGMFAMDMIGRGFVGFLEGCIAAGVFGGDEDNDYYARSKFERFFYRHIGNVRIPLSHNFRMANAIGKAFASFVCGQTSEKEMYLDILQVMGQELLPGPLNWTGLFGYDIVHDKRTINEDFLRDYVPSILVPSYDIFVNRDFMGRTVNKEFFNEGFRPRQALAKDDASSLLRRFTYRIFGKGGYDPEVDYQNPMRYSEDEGHDVPYMPNILQNQSASSIEHQIAGFFGGTGRQAILLEKLIEKLVKGEKISVKDVPVVESWYKEANNDAAILHDYFDLMRINNWINSAEESSRENLESINISDQGRFKSADKWESALNLKAESGSYEFDDYIGVLKEFNNLIKSGADEEELKPYRMDLMRMAAALKVQMLSSLRHKQAARLEKYEYLRDRDQREWAALQDLMLKDIDDILYRDQYGKAVNE